MWIEMREKQDGKQQGDLGSALECKKCLYLTSHASRCMRNNNNSYYYITIVAKQQQNNI